METELPAKKQSSPQRVAASRANGKKSKGPKTPEGRLKCSNAAKSQFKHNLLAETAFLTGESSKRFVQLLENYIETFNPLSEPERNVIQKMVVAHWRQIRTWSTLQSNFNREIARQDEKLPNVLRASSAELAVNQQGNGLALAARHETGFDRQFKSTCATSNSCETPRLNHRTHRNPRRPLGNIRMITNNRCFAAGSYFQILDTAPSSANFNGPERHENNEQQSAKQGVCQLRKASN